MSKVTMPEPALSQVRFKGFACGWLRWMGWMGWEWRNLMGGEKQGRHLITTEQAEAYAAAKVRKALEEAAKVAESCVCSCCCSDDQKFTAQDAAQRIRALIPSTPA